MNPACLTGKAALAGFVVGGLLSVSRPIASPDQRCGRVCGDENAITAEATNKLNKKQFQNQESQRPAKGDFDRYRSVWNTRQTSDAQSAGRCAGGWLAAMIQFEVRF